MVTLNKNIPIGSTTWGPAVNANWQTIEDSLNNLPASLPGYKNPCRAATTGSITLSAPQTIDGVACVVGDRVLVLFQAAPAENGLYVIASGAWTRAPDADSSAEVIPGMLVQITEGAAFAGTFWRLTGSGVITPGSTAQLFKEVGGWCGLEVYRHVYTGNTSPQETPSDLTFSYRNNSLTQPPNLLDLGTVGEARGFPYLTYAAGSTTVGPAGAGRYRMSGTFRLANSAAQNQTSMCITVAVNGVEQTRLRASTLIGSTGMNGCTVVPMSGFLGLAVGDILTVRWHSFCYQQQTVTVGGSYLLERIAT